MAHTIFILGTDPHQCKELQEILQERVPVQVVTTDGSDLPTISESDTIILASEENNNNGAANGVVYRRLLNKLEQQVDRAELLSQLIRLFSSSLQIDELLDRVVTKSTEVLGDMAFVVLSGETGQLKLEAAYSKDPNRLVKLLINTVNLGPQALQGDALSEVIEHRHPLVVSNLQQATVSSPLRNLIDKHGVSSLLAVPIQTKEVTLGAFLSLRSEPKPFTNEDVATAAALADFTAIALENAGLFAELQRSAITDSLTGVYNTRYFHEILARETARADRYSTPLSLLMIDIDSFKLVNDTFGHVVGNEVLKQIAKSLETVVRNTDFVFRCGGDEFGVVLPGTDLEGAMHVAEKILHKIESSDLLKSRGYTGSVTVSIGISAYHRGSHFETLVAEADQALYHSKRDTKNCAKAYRAG
jgi:diguanylate cyclase (GGDEF)-like protein